MGQNLSKWLPRQDHLLAEIYEKAKRPVIFMGRDEQLMARLRRLGVPFGALAEVSSYEYSRLLQLADVSIDPVDWSGGNTTIEALAHGTPVVTLPGKFMRGRHSLAFHQIAGTGGLIAKDEADYVDLIADRDRRNEIMRNANTDALYEDVGVVRALDTFIIETLQRL
jgi:predicted O-linked N-acetylglucosamine transferase (SPINDLY family)